MKLLRAFWFATRLLISATLELTLVFWFTTSWKPLLYSIPVWIILVAGSLSHLNNQKFFEQAPPKMPAEAAAILAKHTPDELLYLSPTSAAIEFSSWQKALQIAPNQAQISDNIALFNAYFPESAK